MWSFYEIIAAEGRWMSDDAKGKVEQIGRLFVAIYSRLSKEALDAVPPIRAWKMVPKFHVFEHLCALQAVGD